MPKYENKKEDNLIPPKLSNKELVQVYLDNGLIQECCDFQFSKSKDKLKQQFKEDFFQDLILVMLKYDNDKLNDAHRNMHMNAWLTRVIQNNIYSMSSNFYRKYVKFCDHSNDFHNQLWKGEIDDEEET